MDRQLSVRLQEVRDLELRLCCGGKNQIAGLQLRRVASGPGPWTSTFRAEPRRFRQARLKKTGTISTAQLEEARQRVTESDQQLSDRTQEIKGLEQRAAAAERIRESLNTQLEDGRQRASDLDPSAVGTDSRNPGPAATGDCRREGAGKCNQPIF